ncbi:MAG: hypothetical protein ACI3VK_02825 [Oscillospiraceae bacterium]
MTVTRAFPPNDGNTVIVNGVKLASVLAVREFETNSVYKVECFGDSLPAAVLTNDTEYGLELRRETAYSDGLSFDGLTDFTVRVGNRLYGGCRCARIERITKPDGPETEVVTIAAGTRQEAENE